jgi:hypothetical protein
MDPNTASPRRRIITHPPPTTTTTTTSWFHSLISRISTLPPLLSYETRYSLTDGDATAAVVTLLTKNKSLVTACRLQPTFPQRPEAKKSHYPNQPPTRHQENKRAQLTHKRVQADTRESDQKAMTLV